MKAPDRGQAKRVLLLEDSEAEARFLRAALLGDGFGVEHFGTVAPLLDRIQRGGFELVIIDLCVPDSKGLVTFQRVSEACPEGTPIIVQSGVEESEVAFEAVRMGAQDYLLKDDLSPRLLVRSAHYALERARIQRELHESRERYALAMNAANEGIWDWNVDTGELHVSMRWGALLGGGAEGPPLVTPEDWVAHIYPADRARFGEAVKAHLDNHTPHLEVEHRVSGPDGSVRWVLCRGLAARNTVGRAIRMAGSVTDITRRKLAEERLVHDALHDALTGLPNRTLFADRLQRACERLRRHQDRAFAVLFLDLDRFKTVNDSLGHAAGDILLRRVAERVSATLRPIDTIARLGGDEFAILLEDVSGEADARQCADRLVSALATPIRVDRHEVFVGISVGIAHSAGDTKGPAELLRDADAALYHAKTQGGGCHHAFEPALHARAARRLAIETDLRRAIDRGELHLIFQPLVELATGRPSGAEALVRWNHPRRGLVGPDEFIPIAEETGLIVPLGNWVVEEACRTAAGWHRSGESVPVSVNISPRQLRDADFVKTVFDTLARHDLPARLLVLEITENALFQNPTQAVDMLRELHDAGIGIDIDDFGTGWSSLAQLHTLPVDRLKIDRSFVGRLGDDPEALEIVRAIVNLAANLHIGVVAEGIETLEQLATLQGLKCELGQGFLFTSNGKMPAAAHPPVWVM